MFVKDCGVLTSSWLYLASRSDRQGAPVLICNTVNSGTKTTSNGLTDKNAYQFISMLTLTIVFLLFSLGPSHTVIFKHSNCGCVLTSASQRDF